MTALLLHTHVGPAKLLSKAQFFHMLNVDNKFYLMGSLRKLYSIN